MNKGITLIALIVTIIILLVLATFSFSAIFGENGVLRRGEESKASSRYSTVLDLELIRIQQMRIAIHINEDYEKAEDILVKHFL